MTQSVQIMCINKTDRFNPHERIRRVGGINPDGSRWSLSLDEAVAGAKAGQWRFYVSVSGKSVWADPVDGASGHSWLKTENDGEQPNNLLSLPECP